MSRFLIFLLVLGCLFSYEQFDVMVPMRDGVELATTVYLPSTGAPPYPVILQRTPYNRSMGRDIITTVCDVFQFAFVSQNLRGTRDSEGESRLFLTDGWGELQDGYDCVQWITEQAFCNGRIGMMGASAPGMTQYMVAGTGHPALKCLVPIFAGASMYHDVAFHGGALRKVLVEEWLHSVDSPHLIDTVYNHNLYSEMWAAANLFERVEIADIPMFHVGGWYDMYTDGQLGIFQQLQERHGSQRIIMAPFGHGSASRGREQGDLLYPENVMLTEADLMVLALSWYSYWLKDVPSDLIDEPPVKFYLTGDVTTDDTLEWNHWVDTDMWPPHGTEDVSFYLQSHGVIDTFRQGNIDSLTYLYDPEDPSPTHGGRDYLGMHDTGYGPKDQAPVEIRDDCIIFTTPPFEEPLTVTGKIRMVLWAKSNRLDTDFAVRVTDVYPDGSSYLMTDGIIRGRLRHGLDTEVMLEPDVVDSFFIDVFSIGHVFNAGHRLRVIISSANYPRFEKNPNTGATYIRDDPDVLVAENTVMFGGDYPSHLIVPVANRDLWAIEQDKRADIPQTLRLSCMPNPFNAALLINAPTATTVEIFDVSGRLVHSFSVADRGFTGDYLWMPDDVVSTGVYVIRATDGKNTAVRRAVFMK